MTSALASWAPRLLLAATAAMGASAAAAATMTFSGLTTEPGSLIYVEDGILARSPGGDLAAFGRPGTAHLDDFGTSLTESITFALASGKRFAALSFDVLPSGFRFSCSVPPADGSPCATSYDNVLARGYRDGALVASGAFDMATAGGTIALSPAFRRLDALVIGVADFPFLDPQPDGSEYGCISGPCSHFDLDDVVLAPVPLPAAAGLLGGALLALAALGRRRA